MKLYRGENIVNGRDQRVSFLRNFLRHGLPLDFINGGNPYRVQQMGFFGATVGHVAKNSLGAGNNGLKHFMSFSESKATAEDYGTTYFDAKGSRLANNYQVLDAYYTEDLGSYLNEDIWPFTQHLLIELDISARTAAHATTPFVYFLPCNGGRNRLLIWDVVAYLNFELKRIGTPSPALLAQFPTVIPDLHKAIGYATTDTEWLVTSLDPIPPQAGVGTSFSALIPHSDVLEIQHHVDPDYFTG